MLEIIWLRFSLITYQLFLLHSVQGLEGQKQKSTTTQKTLATNFNFVEGPENVKWVLTEFSEDSWMPYIGNEKLPQSCKQEWEAAYESLASKFTFLSSENSGWNNQKHFYLCRLVSQTWYLANNILPFLPFQYLKQAESD